jgi:hypothetical protein
MVIPGTTSSMVVPETILSEVVLGMTFSLVIKVGLVSVRQLHLLPLLMRSYSARIWLLHSVSHHRANPAMLKRVMTLSMSVKVSTLRMVRMEMIPFRCHLLVALP